MFKYMNIKLDHLTKHETKKHSLKRFFIVLGIILLYTIYLVYRFGNDGFGLGILTWSAFLMATPIADAGILIDLPIRILTGLRMVCTEIVVWIIGILVNLYFLSTNPQIYNKTLITHTFYQILIHPLPNWIIILLSAGGTFLSLYFGDELMDVIFFHQRKKYFKHRSYFYIIVIIFTIILFYISYKYFLSWFGLKI